MKRTPIVSGEPVDVVIPVRTTAGIEYQKLEMCCKALRAFVPVNRIIMVTADTSPETIQAVKQIADFPIIDKSAIGVGRARQMGLSVVNTRYYASVDSDVVLSKQWYPWCIATIREIGVGACQGYSRPLSRLYSRFQDVDALRIGRYLDLGNTMLSTELVREVGMPDAPFFEDEELRRRFQAFGFSWVTNTSLISTHLVTDFDIFRHAYHFGTLQPADLFYSAKKMLWISRHFLRGRKKYGVDLSIYLLFLEAVKTGGGIVSHYSQNTIRSES